MPKKKVTLPRKSALHFERIPVAEVKKIAPDRRAEPRPRPPGRAERFEGVQFYNDPDALCRIVGAFVGGGIEQGALGLVIATPDHAARIDDCLRARGIDVDGLRRRGSLVTLDAHETLQLFMANGTPNANAFRRAIDSALAHIRRGQEHRTVRAYGEMVDLLWKDGLEAAAIRLETLWNQLSANRDFELLCGYSMGNFYKEGAAVANIHDRRSRLMTGNGAATASSDLRAADPGASTQ